MKKNSEKRYFAAKEGKDCASILVEKTESWDMSLESIGYKDKLRDMYAAYHGAYFDSIANSHKITFGGDSEELIELSVNNFRNIAQHMLTMTTSSRPALDARATNTDHKSVIQTQLANGLLDYYMRDRKYGLEDKLKLACEYGVVLGSGFVKIGWNSLLGEVSNQAEINEANLMREQGQDVEVPDKEYQGDLEFSVLSPLDVIMDLTKEGYDHDWVISRSFKNKHDLIAKYPEHEDKLLKIETKNEGKGLNFNSSFSTETDDIAIYEFYHRRSEALPEGKYMLYVTNDIVLYEGDLPYRKIPVYRISPSMILGTPLGYTPMFDILPIQEGVNTLYSTALTNQATFGVQNILNPTGADIDVNQLGGGLNIIDYNPIGGAKPEALQLTKTPPEVFQLIQMLEKAQETVSGINSVVRGNPEANLRSGSAIAMIQANAIQFMSGLQGSYIHLLEDTGLGMIEMLIDFADSPRVADIVGETNKSYVATFKGEDLKSISRVIVDVANPMTKTYAGRVQMADNLLQYSEITPDQYYAVVTTGNLKVGTEQIDSQLNLMKDENERLLRGELVKAAALDKHSKHIIHHRCLIDDPEVRNNSDKYKNTFDHIQEHIHLARTTDPALLQLIGEQPLPPAPAPQGAPGQPPQGQPPAPQAKPPEGQAMAPEAMVAPEMMPPDMQALQAQNAVQQAPRLPPGVDMPLTMQENLEKIQG